MNGFECCVDFFMHTISACELRVLASLFETPEGADPQHMDMNEKTICPQERHTHFLGSRSATAHAELFCSPNVSPCIPKHCLVCGMYGYDTPILHKQRQHRFQSVVGITPLVDGLYRDGVVLRVSP